MKFVLIFIFTAICTALYIAGTLVNIYTTESSSFKNSVTLWDFCQQDLTNAASTCKSIDALSVFKSCEDLSDRFKAARAFTILTSVTSSVTFILATVRMLAACARRGLPRYILVFFQIVSPLLGCIALAAAGSLYTEKFCSNFSAEQNAGAKFGASVPLYVTAVGMGFIMIVLECLMKARGERTPQTEEEKEEEAKKRKQRLQDDKEAEQKKADEASKINNSNSAPREQITEKKNNELTKKEPTAE